VDTSRSTVTAIIGAGVIGLAACFELASAGVDCVVVDPHPGRASTWAAGGMLAPAAEVVPGEEGLLADLVAASALWPDFARRVEVASGLEVGYRQGGSILVGGSSSDARDLARAAALIESSGTAVEPLDHAALRRFEPTLGPSIRSGWLLPGDHRVDNRRLAEALIAAVKQLGSRIVEDRCVRVEGRGSTVMVSLEHQGDLVVERCVLATGAFPAIEGTDQLGLPAIRPVRGVTLRLASVEGVGIPTRTIRAVVGAQACYLVPRDDGSLVIGATSEEQGMRPIVLAGGVHKLLDAARQVFPGVDELAFQEAAVGFRPTTPDHQPFVQVTHDPRFVAALGHYRNGILLAPLAGRQILSLLGGPA
jgi:glycine oxidase